MTHLLDSDVLIWIFRGNSKIVKRVESLASGKPQAVSVLSVAEIYKNLFPSEVVLIEAFFSTSALLAVDPEIAKLGGLFWRDYHKALASLSLIDCLIAATAKIHELRLVTCNIRHFPMLKKADLINPL